MSNAFGRKTVDLKPIESIRHSFETIPEKILKDIIICMHISLHVWFHLLFFLSVGVCLICYPFVVQYLYTPFIEKIISIVLWPLSALLKLGNNVYWMSRGVCTQGRDFGDGIQFKMVESIFEYIQYIYK